MSSLIERERLIVERDSPHRERERVTIIIERGIPSSFIYIYIERESLSPFSPLREREREREKDYVH